MSRVIPWKVLLSPEILSEKSPSNLRKIILRELFSVQFHVAQTEGSQKTCFSRMQSSNAYEYHACTAVHKNITHIIRSVKMQNESSLKFLNFRPELCPEFCSDFSTKCWGLFKSQPFSIPNPQVNSKKSTTVFWGSSKANETNCCANYFLPGYKYNLHNDFPRDLIVACGSVSHGTKASTTIT